MPYLQIMNLRKQLVRVQAIFHIHDSSIIFRNSLPLIWSGMKTIILRMKRKLNKDVNSYRPQRSCGKVMFLHLSVILFTGGGISVQGVSKGGLCPREGLCPGGLCQGKPPVRTVTCGRYVSYWNAFLLEKNSP